MPAFSSSVDIAAPLRVLVPQVDVRMTASTPSLFTFSAISLPSRRVFDSGFDRPDVDMNSGWSFPILPLLSMADTFLKRKKEQDRQKKKKEKEVMRQERKAEKINRRPEIPGEDPDIAGIKPGPQPPLDW